jgi:O-antigen/teichoic acid export membrane protein
LLPEKLSKNLLSDLGGLHPRFANITSRLVKFATGQTLLQTLQAVNGLFFIWFLSIQDFAIYAVFTGALGFASQLTGFGIAPSIVSLVGMGMTDRVKVGRYIAAGLRVRWMLLVWIIPLGTLLLWIAAEKAEISIELFLCIATCLAFCGYFNAQSDLFAVPLKMLDRLGTIYRISIQSELIRLALVLLIWQSGLLNALSAAMLSMAGLLFTFLALKKAAGRHFLFPTDIPDIERKELVKIFIPRLPNAIFGAFQGQITIIISAIFGGVTQIASIGALGRLSRLLGFLTAANPMLVGPAVARMGEKQFWRRLPWILTLGSLIGGTVACTGFLRPDWLILVLGKNYSDLGSVVWLVTLGAGLSFFVHLIHTVASYRRWVAWWASFGIIGMVVIFQILVVWNFDVTTIQGVLLLSLAAISARIVSFLFLTWVARFQSSWLIDSGKGN